VAERLTVGRFYIEVGHFALGVGSQQFAFTGNNNRNSSYFFFVFFSPYSSFLFSIKFYIVLFIAIADTAIFCCIVIFVAY
jgi:hypothetical protein